MTAVQVNTLITHYRGMADPTLTTPEKAGSTASEKASSNRNARPV